MPSAISSFEYSGFFRHSCFVILLVRMFSCVSWAISFNPFVFH